MDFSKYLIPEDPVMEGFLSKWKANRAAKRQREEAAQQLYDSWAFDNTPVKEIIHQLIEAVKDSTDQYKIYSGKDGNQLVKSNIVSAHTVRKFQEMRAANYGIDRLDYNDPGETSKYPYGYQLLTVDGVACACKTSNDNGTGIEYLIIPIVENGKSTTVHRMTGEMVALAIVKKSLISD